MPSSVATLNRFEVKYLVPTRALPEISAELGEYVVPDPHSAGPQGYGVFSVYWDSPDFEFFWEKVEGLKTRRKLRFRRYLGSADVFLEIKQRLDRTVQKRRTVWPVERVVRAFGDGSRLDWEAAGDDPVAAEAMLLAQRLRLAPRVGILYRRQALFGRFDPELRVTFDSRLQYRTSGLDLARPFETGKYLLDPRATVLEVKYDHRAPVWLTKLIRRHELHIIRLSKFCSAIDREYFGHQLT
ncbi:MAG TPA: polyphosphate polymerase domain-containing protein [Gemmatimonadales bacterium]|nr:polyphosphate polymerase domain-containing protein [Gemmatimonadales bacterium]